MKPKCERCLALSRRHRDYLDQHDGGEGSITARSWCRCCGAPIVIPVGFVLYEQAKRKLSLLSDRKMECKGGHEDEGGWGWRWRFDDVLALVFRDEYREDRQRKPFWPMPPGQKFQEAAERRPVEFIEAEYSYDDDENTGLDEARTHLSQVLNDRPRSRDYLENYYGAVYSHDELLARYEIVAFNDPQVVVQHRATSEVGSFLYQKEPRYYFEYLADE